MVDTVFDQSQFNTGPQTNAVKATTPTLQPPQDINIETAPAFEGYTAPTVNAQTAQNFQAYDPEGMLAADPGDYNPYSAETVDTDLGTFQAAQGEVSPDSLVENRMTGLLSMDSDYMKRAETYAGQLSNRRGILNSSMAIGAAQGAAIDRALPIAQQDASTFGQMDQANLQYENVARQLSAEAQAVNARFNAGQITQAERDNALADIQNRQFQAQQEQQARAENMRAQNEALQLEAVQTQQGEQFNAQLAQEAEIQEAQMLAQQRETTALAEQAQQQFNAELVQQANMFNAEQDLTAALQEYEALIQAEQQFADAKNQETFAVLSAQLNGWLAELDNELQQELIRLEGEYDLAQNAASVNGAIYQELVNSISFIIGNTPDVDEAKAQVSHLLMAAGAEWEYTSVGGLIGLTGSPPATPAPEGGTPGEPGAGNSGAGGPPAATFSPEQLLGSGGSSFDYMGGEFPTTGDARIDAQLQQLGIQQGDSVNIQAMGEQVGWGGTGVDYPYRISITKPDGTRSSNVYFGNGLPDPTGSVNPGSALQQKYESGDMTFQEYLEWFNIDGQDMNARMQASGAYQDYKQNGPGL